MSAKRYSGSALASDRMMKSHSRLISAYTPVLSKCPPSDRYHQGRAGPKNRARASLQSISGLGPRRHNQVFSGVSAWGRGDSIQWPRRMPSRNITSAQPREV